ncbi:FAD-binding protein [Emticicia sp. CRIBPO]|uniref:D-arabinono-1,4-lactone oxidase n=1 Tax=Emticicia sp. CRIBPO TaxID=2683258 RepID=UPI00141300DB|nr:D-arabinono-1,4-lactone oxidase [Emticicia sp. CRIBPO]NBA84917.1 FAD-binding protein [Emticicia sp. CRIBPO]
MHTMSNWSGSVRYTPSQIFSPSSEDELVKIVRNCIDLKKKIRIIGSGHSFTRLCETDQVLISLDHYKGIVSVNKEAREITVKAGTKIYEFGDLSHQLGLAQENLGDIDRQSMAGSISTGTHGTGIGFGNISTQVTAIRFVNGKGEVVNCSETDNHDIFKATQISLGSFGIILELTFRLTESYKLEFTSGKENLFDVLGRYDEINKTTRNFEFYWFPHTETVQTKYSNVSEKEAKDNKLGLWFDNVMENHLFNAVSFPTRYIPSLSSSVAKLSAALSGTSSKVNWSHKVYALPRTVLFNEMEYNVPYEAFADVKKEVVRVFKDRKFDVHFPTENRFVKGDDIWLSPAYQRQSAYIAFHVYKGNPHQHYFKVMEDICRSYDGRPHWGKMHTLQAADFQKIYPKWEDFQAVRKTQDPEGIFLSDYLREVLVS